MVGTTIALIMAASAAASAASTAAKVHADNKAAGLQQDAAKKAQQQDAATFAQQQSNMAPYIQSGHNSMNLLSSLMRPAGSPGSYQPGGPMQQPQGQGTSMGMPPPPPSGPGPMSTMPMGANPNPGMPLQGTPQTSMDMRSGGANPAFANVGAAMGAPAQPPRAMQPMPQQPGSGGAGPNQYINPWAIAQKPFAYTGNSLVSPWTQPFQYPGVPQQPVGY